MLVTLVRLDAAWQSGFDPSATANGSFVLTDGSTVGTPMMHGGGTFSIQESSSAKAIELPYDGGRLAMLVVVPNDLSAFEASLTLPSYEAIVAGLTPSPSGLTLPKFTFLNSFSMLKTLNELGLMLPGSAQWEIFHAAQIDVSESGTVASAQTTTSHTPSAAPAPFVVDHPFVFFIRDQKTGSILFMGRVADPTKTA
jgi:serpin B